ncbi:aminotransferase class V-fold PLP-dependent enzyme [Bacillus sp. FSL W8-0116]|uniref:aminotransferase class V-fold PLP-dependent enzyme n=1 Tax=Bacillus sp. FSL W8-0116 TaxID=2978206 RepID=UPI0030FB1460
MHFNIRQSLNDRDRPNYPADSQAEKWKPRITGWFGQENHSKFNVHQFTLAAGARRFETGTPSFISAYAAAAALRLLLDIGVENISSYLNPLAQFALDYGQRITRCWASIC